MGLRRPAVMAPVPASLVLGAIRHKSKLFAPVRCAAPNNVKVETAKPVHILLQIEAVSPFPQPFPVALSYATSSPRCKPTLNAAVDVAPSKGPIAITLGKNYQLFRLKPNWQAPGRDHNWAEIIALELLTRALVAHKYTVSAPTARRFKLPFSASRQDVYFRQITGQVHAVVHV
ncbi:hypothetical protein FRC06_007885 [Ceratobasidium sp. 370]|nr:hypothetical protein FRC06_007885 [Ceratobasidium sp. 370]